MTNLMCGKCGSPFRAACETCASSALREVTAERDVLAAKLTAAEASRDGMREARDDAVAERDQMLARLALAGDFDLPDGKGWISHEGEVWNLYRGLGSDPQAFPTADAAFTAASTLDAAPAEEKTPCLP